MSTDSILTMSPADVETIRDLPDGRFRGKVVDYKIETNMNGNQFVQFSFRAEEPLDGQDMTGVETNMRVYSKKVYLTKKSAPLAKKELNLFGIDGDQFPNWTEWFDALTGHEVVFTLETETNPTTKRTYRNVNKWRAA
jgi:hypothetical protein